MVTEVIDLEADDHQAVDTSAAAVALPDPTVSDPSKPQLLSHSEPEREAGHGLESPVEPIAPLRESQESVVEVIKDQPMSSETPERK